MYLASLLRFVSYDNNSITIREVFISHCCTLSLRIVQLPKSYKMHLNGNDNQRGQKYSDQTKKVSSNHVQIDTNLPTRTER